MRLIPLPTSAVEIRTALELRLERSTSAAKADPKNERSQEGLWGKRPILTVGVGLAELEACPRFEFVDTTLLS